MTTRLTVVGAFCGLLSCAPPGSPDAGRERVVVSAAISLSDVLGKIAEDYDRRTGMEVVLNLAGTDTLATQLIAGAPVDLFLSADLVQMDRVADEGRILRATRVDLLANRLAVVVPADRVGSVTRVEDLTLAAVGRIAVGDPDAVPAGVYAKVYLESIGLWREVRDKIVPTRNVRAVLAAVEAGNADVGIVYRTDVVVATGAHLAFEVPVGDGPEICYPAAIVTDARNEDAARRFLDYLRGAAAQQMFEQAGFISLGIGGVRGWVR